MRGDEAMTEDASRAEDAHPVLLCFDGSDDAATAIAEAGDYWVRARQWCSPEGASGAVGAI